MMLLGDEEMVLRDKAVSAVVLLRTSFHFILGFNY